MELEGSIHSSITKYRCKIKKLVSDFLAVYSVCLFVCCYNKCSDVFLIFFFQWAKTAIESLNFLLLAVNFYMTYKTVMHEA